MKMSLKKAGWLFLLAASSFIANAQHADFPGFGTVRYEKSINTYALIKEMLGNSPSSIDLERFEQYQKTQPQFKIEQAVLSFKDHKTIYAPANDEKNPTQYFTIPMTEQNNIVFRDLATNASVIHKKVYDADLLIRDSLNKIKWKLTDETREIAGYKCRRANGLILDSIYVVTFYTDDIHISAGPESFGGLPGLILQVALPCQHLIWRAKDANVSIPPQAAIQAPQKGKLINYPELTVLLSDVLSKRFSGPAYKKMLTSFIL